MILFSFLVGIHLLLILLLRLLKFIEEVLIVCIEVIRNLKFNIFRNLYLIVHFLPQLIHHGVNSKILSSILIFVHDSIHHFTLNYNGIHGWFKLSHICINLFYRHVHNLNICYEFTCWLSRGVIFDILCIVAV